MKHSKSINNAIKQQVLRNNLIQTKHFKKRLKERNITMGDTINVINAGRLLEDRSEGENRYIIETRKFRLSLAVDRETKEVILITIIRKS